MFEGLQFTAKQAFRFTRIVFCKPFFVVFFFLKKIEQVQGEGAASDSERQRRLDEQIDSGILLFHILSFINLLSEPFNCCSDCVLSFCQAFLDLAILPQVLSFINPAGRLPLATVWLMFPWSFGLWGQMKGSTTTSPVFRASMVTRGLMYKLCKPKCQQSSAQLVLNRQSQCDQWIQLL